MKNTTRTALIAAAASLMMTATSCNKFISDDERIFTALVTMESTEAGVSLQLNDSTVLRTNDINPMKYGNTTNRALINYSIDENKPATKAMETLDVKVYAIDTIRTKLPVADLGEGNDAAYGKDKIDIIRDWVNIGEDGYLTLRIRTARSTDIKKVHYVNLVDLGFKDGKYNFELRHNADGDLGFIYADGLIAFDLNELRPADGNPVMLNIRWNGEEDGDHSADIRLTFRKR